MVTEERVGWAVLSFEPFKSARLDVIIHALLQEADETLLQMLVNIFMTHPSLGHVLQEWSMSRVVCPKQVLSPMLWLLMIFKEILLLPNISVRVIAFVEYSHKVLT